ncbi:16S rRNA (cytosine(967)-C(5))-methyltransferase RsmB [Butyrivibrio sp. INlla21]|uniref:16S rRNA (cytosine(967)-C(5))-methyltransferase RsmB n=1 Tax=Butyrivibrio sp. INlla21 TaxID=1520811 RepID=UPI0008E7E004|nr:16S rRNA (cytosine(967)-C(5))-methyltransferase RsmB [Butyrivibrio sp. INlla21]SFU31790.1 16S rRNA (cytosine967-C5)-methyltransferase [Butyrivibrio sp. INlla21]
MANIREIVLNILIEYDKEGSKKAGLIKDVLEKYDYLETRDKAFIKRVAEGCIERNIQIDYVLDSFSKVEVKKMQPFIRSLMRMGVYQIMFMDLVPDSAACNEAVKLAQKHKFTGLKGFVNGVLRNVSRNKDNIEYPDRTEDGGANYLSVLYSVPKWLCKMWLNDYGFERTENILKFFLEPRPTVIRCAGTDIGDSVNGPKFVSELKKELEDAGVVVKENPILPYALELEKTDNIKYLPGFSEGKFAVQDVSSMLVTEIANPLKGQTVIDVCAAPGGKSMHAAQAVGEEGKVFSRDVSAAKKELIAENADRLGLNNIAIEIIDAKIHDENMKENGDILYLDVPCSGLGIIGRKNDIKQNIRKEKLSDLTKLQWDIVKSCWDYVKVGGTLMYSTCTVNKDENENMVKRICEEFPFEPVDITRQLPQYILDNDKYNIKDTAKKGYIQLLPGEFGTDGFFIAKLKRVDR